MAAIVESIRMTSRYTIEASARSLCAFNLRHIVSICCLSSAILCFWISRNRLRQKYLRHDFCICIEHWVWSLKPMSSFLAFTRLVNSIRARNLRTYFSMITTAFLVVTYLSFCCCFLTTAAILICAQTRFVSRLMAMALASFHIILFTSGSITNDAQTTLWSAICGGYIKV